MKNCPYCAEEIQDLAIVCKHCGRDLTPTAPPTSSPGDNRSASQAAPSRLSAASGLRAILGSVVLAIVVVVGALAMATRDDHSSTPPSSLVSAPQPPTVTTLPDSAFEIDASNLYRWRFTIQPSQSHCQLTGHVSAISGGNRDVDVLVMSEDDYTNWRNGHDAKVYFQSGQKTAIPLNVTVSTAGNIVLVISNTFSAFTAKTAEIKGIQLRCE